MSEVSLDELFDQWERGKMGPDYRSLGGKKLREEVDRLYDMWNMNLIKPGCRCPDGARLWLVQK